MDPTVEDVRVLIMLNLVNVDTLDYTTGLNGFRNTIICLPPNVSYPQDAFEKTDREAQAANHKITLENSEFALLSRLLGLYKYHHILGTIEFTLFFCSCYSCLRP